MIYQAFFILAAALVVVSNGELQCSPKNAHNIVNKDWITVTKKCNQIMSDQVQVELTAAMTYLAMGAHFSRDTVNRPGFADYFFKSASEEREHAIKILEYLLMRGKLTADDAEVERNQITGNVQSVVKNIIMNPKPKATEWESGMAALEQALILETNVTSNIKNIIEVCEDSPDDQGNKINDYHLADYLTGDFLTEQYEGQRQLAGMISTLGKLMESHKHIGEFLFDKQIAT